jgi:DNA-binding NarL/FixJ family response regulator
VDNPDSDQQVRVALMTEKRLFRDALVACLATQDALTVVGHAATTDDLIVLCGLRSPDVVVVADGGDVRTAQVAAAAVRQRYATIRVVLVYEQMGPDDLATLWRAGVDTLVPASHGLEALMILLRRAAGARAQEPGEDSLTEREREILALVGAGHTVCRIAGLLQTTVHEVENAKRRIYRKLDVSSHSQAVARAAALGIMERPTPSGPRTVRTGGVPLAIVRGPQGPVRQQAVVALLAHGVPFALEQPPTEAVARPQGAEAWHRGPTVLVLVDPRPQDWPAPTVAHSPVVLVPAGDPAEVDLVDGVGRGLAAVIGGDRVAEDLVPAVTLAARGYLALDAHRTRLLLANQRTDRDGLPALTARESDILRSIAAGHTVRQTARSLGIAEKTVENTQARLFRKLGAHNRAGALAAAHGWGLIETDGPEPPHNGRFALRPAGRTLTEP